MMNYNSDLGIYLYLTPVVCSLCFAFSLLAKKERTRPQFYLSLEFLSQGAAMFFCMIAERNWARGEVMRVSDLAGTAVTGIFVLFYCISLMQPARLTWRLKTTWALISVGFCTALILCDSLLPGQAPHSLKAALSLPVSPRVIFRMAAMWSIGAFEIYLTVVVIAMYLRHRRFIIENYSYRENIDLRWMRGIIGLFFMVAVITFVRIVDTRQGVSILFDVSMLVSSLSIYYLGSRQGDIPTGPLPGEAAAEGNPETLPAATTSSVRRQDIRTALLDCFLEQRVYLDPDLTLSRVADTVGTNVTYLSQLINGEFKVNFYTFVNNYRIDYAISLIERHGGNISSDELAVAAGFKSRSTFYEKFHRRTGMTPQSYIRSNFQKQG